MISIFTEEEQKMILERIGYELTVCKVRKTSDIKMDSEFFFFGRTDEELSLVC